MARSLTDIRSKARTHTAMALRTLASIAGSARAPAGARVMAANSLLDRGWGKPDQHVTGEDGGAIKVMIRHIVENANDLNGMKTIEDGKVVIIENDCDT